METRYQRIAREQAERQANRGKATRHGDHKRTLAAKSRARALRGARNASADSIDGFDRDDLGLSLD